MRDQVTFGIEDRGFVYAVARRIVGSPEEADDVTQDTLLVAFRNRDAFRGDSKYRTWLYRIAFTTALGHLRKRGRSREHLAANEDVNDRLVAETPSPLDRVMEAETATIVRDAVSELPPLYRDVLLARVDSTEPEVAEQLGLSLPNVKVRAHRARKQLREALAEVG